MNTYIKQLIELIEDAITKAPKKNTDTDEYDAEVESCFAEEFLQGKPGKISAITGIDKYNFPACDKLESGQLTSLLTSLESLLEAYNWEFMFPEKVTSKVKYQFIIDHWDSEHVHCEQSMVQIETCKFDENDCPFPGHCNVCHSFKCDNDSSHHLDKGLIDFSNLLPDFTEEDDETLRDDIDKFKKLIKEPKNTHHIAGIHNYCDGRCKRCEFTDKCSSFSLNSELESFNKTEAPQDDKQIKVILKATTELIEEELSKKGIAMDDALSEIENEEPEQKVKHSLEKQAESYAEKVKRWLESNQMELESRIVAQPNLKINEDTETITWFQLFIPAKINRAVNGLSKVEHSDLDTYDAHGSAKIALLAIDESLIAWENILKFIPNKEDSILNLLRHLSKLRSELEKFVPEARTFVRPGFDETNF
ncbi:hypothetical protein [Carboxylicivirga marina]|uniref:Uncharacterized protein n=1 Tax=Carboxylicivirga marina TaxID=2800988 RepID=A0ABS1HFJ6_9BACT|nr:hypothetical protein [Carboxylicivirga marina]MBK3516423.1 hypothetical protein [Carboxylicivirga marina]